MLQQHIKHLKIIISGMSLLLAPCANALNVNVNNNANQLMTALTGSGVTVTNLTITGGCANATTGVGLFTNGSTGGAGPVLSEPTGVVVSSGGIAGPTNRLDSSNDISNVLNVMCNSASSDVDMVAIEGNVSSGEYAAIEFDVVPQFATMAIPFQFGSDEFPEYVCSAFNDIVGIFVRGPGIVGPFTGGYENYAKTAGGDLSSINWVNTGLQGTAAGTNAGTYCTPPNGSFSNTAFYTDNSNGDLTGGNGTVAVTNTNLEMDGFTNTLFQPISVTPNATYHVKIAVADAGDRQWDSAAFIHPLFSTGTFSGFDYGDAPNTYGTLTSNAGPSHGIDNTIFMGATVPDNEITGIPSVNANGDDLDTTDDEDGINSFPALATNATSYSVNVNVTNTSGSSARLVGWIDFNRNGTFESGEGTQTNIANGTNGATVALNWPIISGLVIGDTYARLRFSSDPSLSVFTTGSAMSDGEVEDYALPIVGVTFTKYVSTNPVCADTLQTLSVSVGTNVYYCYTVTNPNASALTITTSSDDQGHDISALEVAYATSASNAVIIGPLVAGGAQLPTGVTTVNIASVTANIGGANIVANDSASLTVSVVPPASGSKQLYFDAVDTGAPDLTRDPTNALANTRTNNIAGGITFTLNQGIPFAAPFTISGSNNITTQLVMRRRNGGGARTVQVQLFINGVTQIGANSAVTWNANGWQTLQVLTAVPADVILNTGDFIRVVITNTSANNNDFQLRTLRNGIKSQLQIQSSTVINVDSIDVYAAADPATTQYSSYEPGSTVFIRATVSDPFGTADITGANITITDSSPTVQVNNQAMTPVLSAPPSAATRVFEYQYGPVANVEGFWTLNVTANEGFENTVTHTLPATMTIGVTNITFSKNSTVLSDPYNATADPKAIPGAIVEYTTVVENSGFGYVDIDSVLLTDPIDPITTFYFGSPLNPVVFTDGVNTSGLTYSFTSLASTTDDIDFSSDGGTSFVTPTVDANGFDTTVPAINFIRINPKGGFNGSDGVNHPSMEIKFKVRVE